MIDTSAKQIEQASRILCEMRGRGPDEPAGLMDIPAWTLFMKEIHCLVQGLDALRQAGILHLNDDNDDGR
jgi:hypothetical protein